MFDFLSLFYNPERLFKYHLVHNPYFPFKEVLPKVFVLHDASYLYILELFVVLTLAALYIAVVITNDWSLQLILIPAVVLVILVPVILRGRHKRTLVFDANALLYEYYVDDELIYQGHCHNLYIRIKVETGGSEESYFYSVVVNGYSVHEYHITNVSRKKEKLYKMGRRLAANLNLNFFDSVDRSTNHVIRHYCPYVEKESSHHDEDKAV